MFTLVRVEHEETKICECILMSCYPVLHFKKARTCEDESGRTGVQPHQQTAWKITERRAKNFLSYREIQGENTRASSYTKRQAGRDRQAGRQRDRPRQIDSARPQFGNPMERLASRQHLGRIIESLEKTGAPEPLSCVNVALQILSAVCADCQIVLRVYTLDSLSVCKQGHINPTDCICVLFRCHMKCTNLND